MHSLIERKNNERTTKNRKVDLEERPRQLGMGARGLHELVEAACNVAACRTCKGARRQGTQAPPTAAEKNVHSKRGLWTGKDLTTQNVLDGQLESRTRSGGQLEWTTGIQDEEWRLPTSGGRYQDEGWWLPTSGGRYSAYALPPLTTACTKRVETIKLHWPATSPKTPS